MEHNKGIHRDHTAMPQLPLGLLRAMVRVAGLTAATLVFAITGASAQIVVSNADFDTDVSAWDDFGGSSISFQWHSSDHQGLPTSGSAQLVNTHFGYANLGVAQCIDGFAGGEVIDFGAWVRIPTGQSASGRSRVELFWFTDAGCTGIQIAGPSTSPLSEATQWEYLGGYNHKAPTDARSVRMSLSNEKISSTPGFEVFFDGVHLGPSPPGVPGYELVVGETEVSTLPSQQLEVSCPGGKRALGAGWAILGPDKEIREGYATYSAPTWDGSSWMVNAQYRSWYDPHWKLQVTVICARVTD